MMDLILRQARLMDGTVVDIGIEAGKITAVSPNLPQSAPSELDANQQLTLPAFVNGQLHACKSFWRRPLSDFPPHIQQLPPFDAAQHVKQGYTEDDVFTRVDEVMRLAIVNGTCAIRLFADVDEASGLTAVRALLRIREKYSPLMTVQVVAFPQDGASDSTIQLMQEALSLGADVVGGIPWIEPDEAAQRTHTDMCFRLAQQFGCDLHFVCDDMMDSRSRSLIYVAEQTIANGWHGRVATTQCAALSTYPADVAAYAFHCLKEANITIFSNSHVSLIATDFDEQQQPWPRSIAPVRQLLAAGIPVACGQDDIDNWFYPFGRNDMLEVAQFMAHNGRFAWHGDVNNVLPLVTATPASVLGLTNYGLQVGAAANLVVLDAPDWHQAIQFQPDKRFVILRGQLVSQTERKTDLFMS
ncbi:MAG: amidohydrolase family protein [Chloroflexota bacterium]